MNLIHQDMENQQLEKLSGIVERVTFFSVESGFSVLKVKSFHHMDLVTVIVHQCKVFAGASMEFYGQWDTHPKHGSQFVAKKSLELKPSTSTALEKYLGSGLIFGVGPKIARKIVQTFGSQTLDVFENQIDRLTDVPGIAKKKLQSIQSAWSEHRSIRDIMIFLQEYGISTIFATKIYKQYGNDTITVLKENPYKLAKDIYGIGFFSADKIALSLGIGLEDSIRLKAAIKHVLAGAREDGHCYLKREQIHQQVASLLQVQCFEKLDLLLSELSYEKEIVQDEIKIKDNSQLSESHLVFYSKSLYYDEMNVAQKVVKWLKVPISVDQNRIKDWLKRYNQSTSFPLSQEQESAVVNIVANSFSILTGGPGCGKTTTIKVLVKLLLAMKKQVVLAAPTGRAAQRMGEVVGMQAKTIHRLLIWEPQSGRFKKNEADPLEGDFFIIDETSMLDINLSSSLLLAIKNQAQVLFIGDVDQLPSVGAGNVLKDLIFSHHVPCFRLTQIFRQGKDSAIIEYAHQINQGKMPDILSPFKDPKVWNEAVDCLFIDSDIMTNDQAKFVKKVHLHFQNKKMELGAFGNDGIDCENYEELRIPSKFLHVSLEDILASQSQTQELMALLKKIPTYSSLHYGLNAAEMVVHLVKEVIPRYLGACVEVQVLSPMTRGSLGTSAINTLLQDRLNPFTEKKSQYFCGGKIFREGDRVIQKRNNYDLEVFNGDIGKVQRIDSLEQQMLVEFRDGDGTKIVTYEKSQILELDLAYAITIHKSQGSEFPVVIIPIMTQHFKLLMRNLVYTGLTRGKKQVVFVGQRKALFMAINNNKDVVRQTYLSERVTSLLYS